MQYSTKEIEYERKFFTPQVFPDSYFPPAYFPAFGAQGGGGATNQPAISEEMKKKLRKRRLQHLAVILAVA